MYMYKKSGPSPVFRETEKDQENYGRAKSHYIKNVDLFQSYLSAFVKFRASVIISLNKTLTSSAMENIK